MLTYDGLNQLTGEVRTGPVPFLHSYTYDHNGNRLTKTVNGSLLQSFTYDAHDKLTGGINEGESYDANGNLLAQTLNGQTTRFAWDDADRLTSQTFPDGHAGSYICTGLGMRLRKNDPTGNYWYDADGVSPASDVLSDGYSTFTPGISEINGNGSRFYLADAQGNSRGLLDGGQGNPDGYNWDAFGNAVSRSGSNPTAFAWNEESGYQTDADSGLKLLGHRYLDSRTGRFLSQDPAGDGDNWYAYADNDPMDETDPSGLSSFFDPSKAGTAPGDGPSAWGDYNSGDPGTYDFFSGNTYTHSVTISAALNAAFTSTSGPMMGMGPASMGGGISAGGGLNHNGHEELESLYKKVENINKDIGERKSDLQKNFKTLPERADNDKLKPRTSRWGHRMLINNLKRIKQERLSDIRLLLQKAGMAADVIETVLQDVVGDVPIVFYYDYSATHRKYYRGIDVTPQM